MAIIIQKPLVLAVLFVMVVVAAVFIAGGHQASAGAVTLDGTISGGEYSNSVLVDKTPDLGGVYDPGTSGSFAGGAVNCHSDWTLYWEWDATNLYIAADPMDAASSCADTVISAHLLPFLGDPNLVDTSANFGTDCTGTFFNLNFNNFHQAFGCPGGPFEFELGTSPPSSTWSFAQIAPGASITPLEWAIPRADLNKFSDTTYTDSPNFDCVWFRVSAFDSRSVDNGTGPGARTIWLKLNPGESDCGGLDVDIDIKPGSDPNCIKPKNKGVVPVAILGSGSFDVSDIDAATVEIDDDTDPTTSGISPVRFSTNKDVSGDGINDFVAHFKTSDLKDSGWLVTNQELFITAELFDGTPILGGPDNIQIAGDPSSECR